MTQVETQLLETTEEELVLTTIDNPFNPKTEYEKWRMWDADNGYNTEEYLARLTNIPGDVELDDEATISVLTNKAVQSILENDPLGVYKLV